MDNQDIEQAKTDVTHNDAPAAAPVEATPAISDTEGLISIDQFMQTKLRVAEILAVEAIPKSKKLVKLQVSLGEELGKRQILAGIAPYFEDLQSLVGKKIVVVANLKPAKLMGEESQGMLLAASTADGSSLNLLDPGAMPAGAEVR